MADDASWAEWIKKDARKFIRASLGLRYLLDYSLTPSLMQFTGHVSTQAPQSMQPSSSITLLLSDSVIAPTGQESSHAPQLMHSSEMV